MIEEYYDFDYFSGKAIDINHKINENFTPGYYYDLKGKKIFRAFKIYIL